MSWELTMVRALSFPKKLGAIRCLAIISLSMMMPLEEVYAGFMISPELKWGNYSSRPEDEEPTPNYTGLGGGLHMGYSAGQIFDIAAFGFYIPGALSGSDFGGSDAAFYGYGGEMAFRIKNSVYFALRAGEGAYELYNQKKDWELSGNWGGTIGGISLGAIHQFSKRHFIQTSFDLYHGVMENTSGERAQKRKIDGFAVSIGYVFNGYKNRMIENTIFKGFLDSFNLF
jgi:hypothetical protein